MALTSADDPAIRAALTGHYGRPGSPYAGLEPFEAFLAVALDYAQAASKRDRILAALREGGLLSDPQALAEADPREIEDVFFEAGLTAPRNVPATVGRLARWLVDRHHGMAEKLSGEDGSPSTSTLREELLQMNNVGPLTADAMLLFALNRAAYPLDRATFRVLVRHGWIDIDTAYDDARDSVERLTSQDPSEFVAFSGWMERLGKEFCRPSVAKCAKCPLRPFLPEHGPVDPQG